MSSAVERQLEQCLEDLRAGRLTEEALKQAEIPSEFTDGDKKKGTRMISLKEAATQAGVPLETLRTRIKRARKRDQWQPFVASGEVGRGQLFANEEELRRWLGKPQN